MRFRVPDEVITFDDAFAGGQWFDVARSLGDFVVSKSDGTPAYQLAVVVDDAAAGVTDVVRGDDLLDSTPRQMLLYRALGLAERIPTYYHLPLVVGPDGRVQWSDHLARYRHQNIDEFIADLQTQIDRALERKERAAAAARGNAGTTPRAQRGA